MELGGDVLWAIMFVLFAMWTFILERVWYIYRVYPARKRAVVATWEIRPDTSSWYARKIRDGLISEAAIALKRNICLIKALIAICSFVCDALIRQTPDLSSVMNSLATLLLSLHESLTRRFKRSLSLRPLKV